MGKKKYISDINSLFEKSLVVDFASIRRIVRKEKNIKQYAKKIVRNLIKQGKIYNISKGLYSSNPESSLVVFAFSPAYLGLQDALSFHDLWEQETVPVVVTTRNVRKGIRKVMGVNFLVKRISKKYFFGFDYYPYELEDRTIYLPYSDIEKTFIDLVHFRQYIDKETIKEFKKRIDKKKFNSYLKAYPKMTRKRVLNVLKKK
jgi:predicted transcriptional regulator of viral defense system